MKRRKMSNFASAYRNSTTHKVMIKALFFDIDGTLVSFNTHAIPQSTVNALTRAKEKGIKIFISTGRPMPLINNLGAISHLIDGYVTTNGACCTIGNEAVRLTPLDNDDVTTLLDYVQKEKAGCLVMCNEGTSMLNRTAETDHVLYDILNVERGVMSMPLDELVKRSVLQITPFITLEQEQELVPTLKACTATRWYPAFCDITSNQADKGRGLEAVAKAAGIAIEETMAFGDGGNDIPILKRAGTGVAMGNALDNVKDAADYVTADIDDDGVAKALEHFGVTD